MAEGVTVAPSPNERRAQVIADRLEGSSLSLSDVLEDGEEDDTDLLSALDALVGRCETCDWWFPADELSNWRQCQECEDSREPL